MTGPYRVLEQSRAKGKPNECYHFFSGSKDWFYTSSKKIWIDGSDRYIPLEITRSETEGGGQDRPGAVDVTVPTDSNIGLVLQAGSSPAVINLRILRVHKDAPTVPIIIFNGEVQGADVEGETLVIHVIPFQSRMSVEMPRGVWQRFHCRWNTYDPLTCGVNPAGFTFTGAVTAINGLIITVPGAEAFAAGVAPDYANAFYPDGVCTKGDRKVPISNQDHDDIILQFPLLGLKVGDTVSLLAGDDRTPRTCLNKFNNIARNMSFSLMPVDNPHYGQGLRTA